MLSQQNNSLAQGAVRTEWSGAWIWPEDVAADRNVYALFRRILHNDTPATLELHITADSFYTLYLDGRFISRGPARSHIDYYSFDTLALELDAGEHCLAVLVHHVGEVNATMMLGRPGLLADISLTGADGEIADLSTGSGWKAQICSAWRKELPCMMSHFGFWEDFDLRLLPGEWTSPTFDDSAWASAVEIGRPPCAPWTRLVTREIAQPRYESLPAQPVAAGFWVPGAGNSAILSECVQARERTRDTQPSVLPIILAPAGDGTGRYLSVDFGRTVSGYPILRFAQTAPGQVVDVSYDELLTETGAVNPERSYAHLSDRYILSGGPVEIRATHPRGFRYLTIDCAPGAQPLVLEQVSAIEETYPFEQQPSFVSPDEQLNRFVVRSAETVRICTTDAFTDCPTRERVHWMEDLYMHNRVAAYTFADTAMSRRALFQAAQNALPDGRINGFMPSERTNCAFAASSLMWLQVLVDYWLHAGADDIHDLLPTATRLLECLASYEDETELLASWPSGQFWDWAPIEAEGCLLLTNAAYAQTLDRLAEHAIFRAALGEGLAAKAARIRQQAHQRFWQPELQHYADALLPDGSFSPICSTQANTMAVLAGVCPPAERIPLLRRITDPANLGPTPIGENSFKPEYRAQTKKIVPMGTLWFAHFLCQALFEVGQDAEALQQMRDFWGAYDDLYTFPETRIQHGNTGFCHGWAGGPAYLLPAYVLGIQPTAAGWGEVRFQPHPGNLPQAHGAFKTPLGELRAEWQAEGNGYRVKLSVPSTMRVTVDFLSNHTVIEGTTTWEMVIE